MGVEVGRQGFPTIRLTVTGSSADGKVSDYAIRTDLAPAKARRIAADLVAQADAIEGAWVAPLTYPNGPALTGDDLSKIGPDGGFLYGPPEVSGV